MASSQQIGLNDQRAVVEPGNVARCDPDTAGVAGFPEHLYPCPCETHDAVCAECGYHITISPDRIELGHARARNRTGDLPDCPHRPPEVDPSAMDHSNCVRCGRVMERTTVREVCVVCEGEDQQPSLADYVGGEPA